MVVQELLFLQTAQHALDGSHSSLSRAPQHSCLPAFWKPLRGGKWQHVPARATMNPKQAMRAEAACLRADVVDLDSHFP